MSTTLEILAPYLPYGIEVEELYPFGHHPSRHVLRGIDCGGDFPVLVGSHPEADELSSDIQFRPHAILPVLRSFADLCTPLEDGTVPAVEVAKLLSNDWANEQAYSIRPKLSPTDTCIIVRAYEPAGYMDDADREGGHIHLLADWNFLILLADNSVVGLENTLEAYAYLRRHHFAVGLTADQYIRKS